jgi:hypothetical protein
MPDKYKRNKLREMGWRRSKCCASCKHASTGGRVRFGYCQHPCALYIHAKHGERKAPCHAGAVCDLYEAVPVVGLDDLNELVNG